MVSNVADYGDMKAHRYLGLHYELEIGTAINYQKTAE